MILVNYRSRQAAHGEHKIMLIILDNLGLQERRRPALSRAPEESAGGRRFHPSGEEAFGISIEDLVLLIRKGRSRPSTVPGLYERDPERTPEAQVSPLYKHIGLRFLRKLSI